jgi:hypothetical protein
MDVGGIFRNIFRLPSSKKDESTVNTSPPTGLDNNAGIYDDTDLAARSQSQGMNRRRNQNPEVRKLPSFRDIDGDKQIDVPPPRGDGEREMRGFPGSAFVFGDLFSMAREMFVEMERSMKDMDEFFSNDAFFPNHDVNIPSVLDGADLIPGPEEEQQKQNPDNIRDQVLKPDPSKRPTNEGVDPDLDDLYKNSLVPRIPGGTLEDAWGHGGGGSGSPNPTSRFQYSRTFRQYKSSPEGTIIHGKTIRETNEGRQVTTYRRNDKGEVEENTEFIPRGESEPLPAITDSNDPISEEFPSFSGGFRFRDFFFPPRPRM